MERIEQISDLGLYRLTIRAYDRVSSYMESLGADALRYGWDWRTANVLLPSLCRSFYRARGEFVKRAKAKGIAPGAYSLALSAEVTTDDE